MSYHRGGGHRRGNNFNRGGGGNRHGGGGGGGKRHSDAGPVDENNPVVLQFREYARELDEKHDRYERIVKCSRDITIESKRIIFLLHTVDAKKNNQSQVCEEAKNRLHTLCRTHFATIAKELQGLDPYQFSRAYTAGMQEFIEAYTFYEYVSSQNISHWKGLQEKLRYKVSEPKNVTPAVVAEKVEGEQAAEAEGESMETEDPPVEPASPCKEVEITCLLSPMDFVLGVGDLSGEIMRKCINSLGSGDVDSCFEHCRFMQELYKGFVSVGNPRNRDFNQKLFTLRQSLLKSENVCYNVKVRGGEAAKWGSTDDGGASFGGGMPKDNLDEDEGVFF